MAFSTRIRETHMTEVLCGSVKKARVGTQILHWCSASLSKHCLCLSDGIASLHRTVLSKQAVCLSDGIASLAVPMPSCSCGSGLFAPGLRSCCASSIMWLCLGGRISVWLKQCLGQASFLFSWFNKDLFILRKRSQHQAVHKNNPQYQL